MSFYIFYLFQQLFFIKRFKFNKLETRLTVFDAAFS